jgi:hypothetical protein
MTIPCSVLTWIFQPQQVRLHMLGATAGTVLGEEGLRTLEAEVEIRLVDASLIGGEA